MPERKHFFWRCSLCWDQGFPRFPLQERVTRPRRSAGDSGMDTSPSLPTNCSRPPYLVRQIWYKCKKVQPTHKHTSYLSRTHGRCPWRTNLSCGEISNSCTWQMWRSLKFIHMWINFKFLHMTDVEKSEISFNMCTIYGILLHFKLFCCKICVFLRFTLFCRKIGLLRFTRFCVEKILAKNSVRGEKMTNMRYGPKVP